MVKRLRPDLNAVFSALADPTRRAIVERLLRGEASVSVLAGPFAVSLPAISKQISVLERAGLVERRKLGRVQHCRLRAKPLSEIDRWLAHHRVFWQSSLDRLEQFLEKGATS